MSGPDAELELGGPRIDKRPSGNAELQLGIPPKHLEQDAPNRGHQT